MERSRRGVLGCLFLASIILTSSTVDATTEICGNGIDDDGNGMADEGCYPSLTTGICESPLSCEDTGLVSWLNGSLHYSLPPDITPKVPYGPNIGFRRIYTSMSTPGATPASVNKTPLGPHWQHTYLTYLYPYTVGSTSYIMLHTTQGRDVLYTYSSTLGYYTPQAGEHVISLSYNMADTSYRLLLLTGETLKYNSSGQLIEIWDNLGPTPNKVLITWDSLTNGNVSTVTDASGQRRLLFTYVGGLMRTMQFQVKLSGTWTTEHTTTYDYAAGVTRDATSFWYTPASLTEWTTLLAGTGISAPAHLWLFQETSGSAADSIGSSTLSTVGGAGISYQNAVPGWARKSINMTANGASYLINNTDSTLPDVSTTSIAIFGLVAFNATPAGDRDVMAAGDATGPRASITSSSFPT